LWGESSLVARRSSSLVASVTMLIFSVSFLCWGALATQKSCHALCPLGLAKKNWLHFSMCVCHPCEVTMLIFSVSFLCWGALATQKSCHALGLLGLAKKMVTLLDFGVRKNVYTSRFWCANKCLHFSILVCKKLLTLLDFDVQTLVYTSRFWSARKNAYTSGFWCAENCLHFSIFVYKKKVYTYRLVCVVLAQGPC